MHLCKASAGWRVHFQDSTCGFEADFCEDEPPGVHSVADVRALLATREWQLADECGEVWAPGEESMRLLDEICAWWPDGRESRALGGDYRDPEGFWWTPTDFR